MSTPDLKPRAIAALCYLRGGMRATNAIRGAIGDASSGSTRDLMTDLRRDGGLVALGSGGVWFLTYDGIAWCEDHGMPVSDEAKAAAADHWESERATGGAS